jgi:hypothetical protein
VDKLLLEYKLQELATRIFNFFKDISLPKELVACIKVFKIYRKTNSLM